MRGFMAIMVAIVAIAAAVHAGESTPAATPKDQTAQCIRDNATKVERAITDLNQAVVFLVDKVCAEPVAAENARRAAEQSRRMSEYWQKLCDAQKAAVAEKHDAESNPAKGVDYCMMSKVGFTGVEQYSEDDDGGAAYVGSGSPSDVGLAARLLLDLRLTHKPTEHSD